MTVFQTLAILLTFAALGGYINIKFLKLPATVGLMAVAMVISLAAIGLGKLGLADLAAAQDFVGHIDFSDIFMHGMLSFLLFAGALHIDINELRKFGATIGILATAGVVATTFITGTIVWVCANWLGFSFPYMYALLFGALIAPTDPIAVIGIMKEAGTSKSLRIKISGESLFNDGVGVVLFLAILATLQGGALPAQGIAFMFLWEVFGSLILGLALGWGTYRLMRGVDDAKVEVLLTLALVAGGYSLAEFLHISAPITMVVAGLLIGNHGRLFGMSDKSREHLDTFWELLDEILNAMLFMLIGLEMLVIPIHGPEIVIGLLAFFAVLVGRFISVTPVVSVLRMLRHRFERGTIPLLVWGGLRGGISVALALSLPPGPERDLIVGMTYVTVVFSVLLQGTTFRHAASLIMKPSSAS